MTTIPTHSWEGQLHYSAHHLADKEPTDWIVYQIVSRPSLNLWFGAPGSLKSMLAMDLAVSVAMGRTWLTPENPNPKVPTFPTQMGFVLWADFDQGKEQVDRRLEAFEREYGMDINSKMLGSISMPYPPWSATNHAEVKSLAEWVKYRGTKLVVMDTLAAISGGRDENSSEMLQVMNNLRMFSDRANVALLMLHHSRKTTGFKARLGEQMRGFSGIEGALDTAYSIETDGTEYVTARPAKSRSDKLRPFTAKFYYEHHPGVDLYGNPIRDLKIARFYGEEPPKSADDLADIIVEWLEDSIPDKRSAKEIIAHVQDVVDVGQNKIRDVVAKLWSEGYIKKDIGARNKALYYI